MKTALLFILPLIALLLVAAPLIPLFKGAVSGKKVKRNVILNLSAFFGVCLLAVLVPVGGLVSAAETTAAVASSSAGLGYIAAALVTGLACVGAGIAVAAGAPASIGAVSEDPKVFAKALIFVVLGEGIAIYGLLISILILNNL